MENREEGGAEDAYRGELSVPWIRSGMSPSLQSRDPSEGTVT
jgi:hypothetical protein